MSVAIKGMKMPKNCGMCSFSRGYTCFVCEDDLSAGEIRASKRPDDCPLVEIPTPHGRLIDINDVVLAKRPTTGKHEKNEAMALYKAGWDTAIETIIENAPTIIEAEDSVNEGVI